MKFVKKEFVCPYCFEKQDLYKIQFRCQNSPSKCSTILDKEFAKFRGISPIPMSRVFDIPIPTNKKGMVNSFFIPRELRCPNCTEKSTERVCPACHSELPYTIGDHKDMIFAFIGAKESGKSHYVSVLIDSIQNNTSRTFNSNLLPLNDNTIRKYREEFYDPVFTKKETIRETHSARSDYNVKMPLTYSLSFLKRNILGKQSISNVSTISFFDTAGEDLNSLETMRTENKYIYNSSGIILLIDPLQISEVRDKLRYLSIDLPEINTESKDIVVRVATLIRTANKIRTNEHIEIPIAITLSKIDALSSIIDSSSNLFKHSKHDKYYNLSEAESINTEVESIIDEWAGSSLVNQVTHNFRTYAFFGISALGSNPHGSNKISKLRPIRVEDPFLWLLYKNNIIKSKQKVQKINKLYVLAFLLLIVGIFLYNIFNYYYYFKPLTIVKKEVVINHKDLVGKYYGFLESENIMKETMYLVIKQHPFDTTKHLSYLIYNIRKRGINTQFVFNKNSYETYSETLGYGKVFKDISNNRITIESELKNELKWHFERQ